MDKNPFDMVSVIKDTLIEYNMLSQVETLYVALSGGADSMALLHCLKALKTTHAMPELAGIAIEAIHINHQLRTISIDEEQKVRSWCKEWSIPCLVHKVDVKAQMGQGTSLEEAARIERYKVFDTCRDVGRSVVALAHHRDDQAETVLLNLFRGSGLKGLGGMHYTRDGYIRPMLDIPRTVIESYCHTNAIPYVNDESNQDTYYKRNALRHQVMPLLEEVMGYDIRQKLTETAALLRDDEAYLSKCTQNVYENCVVKESENRIAISIRDLLSKEVAMQRRLLRYVLMRIKNDLKGITFKHINQMLLLCRGETGKRFMPVKDVLVVRSYEELIVMYGDEAGRYLEATGEVSKKEQSLDFKGVVMTQLEAFNWDEIPKNLYTKWVDYDRIKGNLVVRTRKNGDFIRVGANLGKKKLKDLFIDMKVPKEERNDVPIVADENEVIWVVGYRMNDAYKVTTNTKTILQLEYIKEDKN